MEGTGLMWEKWMEIFFFSPELEFQPLTLCSVRVLFPICTLIWRSNSYVTHQGKSLNRRNENTKTQLLVSTDDMNHSIFVSLR